MALSAARRNLLLAPGRAGWKPRAVSLLRAIAWFVVNNALVIPLILIAAWLQHHIAGFPDLSSPLRDDGIDGGALIGAESIPFLACLLATLGFSAFSSRPGERWGQAFLRHLNCVRPSLRSWNILTGTLAGLLAITLAFGCEYALGGYDIVYTPDFSHIRPLILFAIGFLLVGMTEETATRGYLQNALSDCIGFLPAAFVTSLWFVAEHILGQDPLIGAPQIVTFALFSCATLWLTGSLRFMIGFHAAWDWGQTAFFGTNDSGYPAHGALFHSIPRPGMDLISGGSVGPEGGLPAMILWLGLAVLAWVIAWKHRASSQLP